MQRLKSILQRQQAKSALGGQRAFYELKMQSNLSKQKQEFDESIKSSNQLLID